MKHLRTLNKFFLKYKWKLILGLVVTIISRIFGLYFIPLVGNSTDAIEQYINGEITGYDSLKAELLKNILLLVGTTLISAFFTFLMRQTFIVVSRHIEYDLKNV
ncbi:MAG TPA: ABC transporter, partial [Zunongwangia profunda]|nr:ABC transporter [Zunongwangia profunda]